MPPLLIFTQNLVNIFKSWLLGKAEQIQHNNFHENIPITTWFAFYIYSIEHS